MDKEIRSDTTSRKEKKPTNRIRTHDLINEYDQSFNAKRWLKAQRFKAQNLTDPNLDLDPGPKLLRGSGKNQLGALQIEGKTVFVDASKNPAPDTSFGFISVFADVKIPEKHPWTTLALKFNPKKLGWIERESLRMFRFDPDSKQYKMAPITNVSQAGDYVWGQITQSGTYALIGVHSHPAVLGTVRTICGFRNLHEFLNPGLQRLLRERICALILCPPDGFREIFDPPFLDNFDRHGGGRDYPIPRDETGQIPGSLNGAGNICDLCFGNPGGLLPECEIVDRPPPPTCVDTRWSTVGPVDLAGMISQVVVDPTDSRRLYAAAWNGGIWTLRVDHYPGSGWRPLTDQLETLMMSAIAVAPSDGEVLYAAGRMTQKLYRSADRGGAWIRTSDDDLGIVRKILVHRSNPENVWVASQTGLRHSHNGGASWELLKTGNMTDAAMDPQDASIVYLAQRNQGIFKSFSSGFGDWGEPILNWSRANSPSSTWIELDLGYRRADGNLQDDANRTVAVKFGDEVFVNHQGGGGGDSAWASKGKRGGNGYGGWCHALAVDPFDPNVILAGQQELYRTTNGGDDWDQVATYYRPHEDQQSVAFDRENANIAYLANDGGVFRSQDDGETWWVEDESVADAIMARRNLNLNLVTSEFYRVGVHPNNALGNVYHSGLIGSTNLDSGRWKGREGHAWEFNYVYAHQKFNGRFFVFSSQVSIRELPLAGSPGFNLRKFGAFKPYTRGGGTSTAVGAIAVDLRPASNTILVGAMADSETGEGYRLLRTLQGDNVPTKNADDTWNNLPIWETVIDNGTDPIVTVQLSRSTPGMGYAMSHSGLTFRKADVNDAGGWDQMGQWTRSPVRQMAINPVHDTHIYAITSNRFARSVDGGASWTEHGEATLPASEFNSIVSHPANAALLYLGADVGVFLSTDEGDHWSAFDTDLPNAEVLQIFWVDDYLYAVTHGRGLWRRHICA
jgi:hypothetical protein